MKLKLFIVITILVCTFQLLAADKQVSETSEEEAITAEIAEEYQGEYAGVYHETADDEGEFIVLEKISCDQVAYKDALIVVSRISRDKKSYLGRDMRGNEGRFPVSKLKKRQEGFDAKMHSAEACKGYLEHGWQCLSCNRYFFSASKLRSGFDIVKAKNCFNDRCNADTSNWKCGCLVR